MCNLNIAVKGKYTDIINEFANATAYSFISNSHSEGMYFSAGDKLVKSERKIPTYDYHESIKESEFVIGHERIATSGFTMDNCQPFDDRRFVFVHNGVINIKASEHPEDKSDSNIFFSKFLKNYEKTGKIVKSLDDAFKTCEGGYYSIFIYDKKLNVGYYFKHSRASINIIKLKRDAIFITTSSSNLAFLPDKDKQYKVKNDIVYRFYIEGGKPRIVEFGKLRHNETGKKEEKTVNLPGKEWPKTVYGCGMGRDSETRYDYDWDRHYMGL